MTPEESIAWKPGHPGGSTDILPFYTDIHSRIPSGGKYVEIGVFFGRSLSFMGELRSDLELYAVDPWEEGFVDAGEVLPVGPDLERCRKYGGLFPAFLATMQEFAPAVLARTRVIRAPSTRGLKVFEDSSVDFVWIDGDHGQDAVAADCEEALRIVKPGGIVAGHDYLPPWNNWVQQDVDRVLGKVEQAPWPVAREGWSEGKSSCFWRIR